MLSATPLWFPIRARRRSGGHPISGLPGSSTERPVAPRDDPGGSHRLALAVPAVRRPKRRSRTGPPSTQRWVFPPGIPGVPTIYPTRFPPQPATMGGASARSRAALTVGPTPVVPPGAFGATSPSALHPEEPPCARSFWGVRTATSSRRIYILLALGDPLSFRAGAELAPPERSRSSKNVP